MQTFKLLSNDSVLLSQPVLIEHFGRTGAQLLSQLHYWLSKKQDLGSMHNGVRWIYNSAKAWAAQICISERQIERVLSRLQTIGVVQTKQLSRNKFDRTNHFTINYAILERYIGSDTLKPAENSIPTKCRLRYRKNDGMYIQKLPNKDFNKSDEFLKNLEVVGQGANQESEIEHQVSEQVKQVKDLNLKNPKRLDALQETPTTCLAIEKNQVDETNLLLPKTATAQDMLKIWNDSFAGKAETKLNKDLGPLLVSAFKNKFESNLKNWQHYCEQLKSSLYLMADEFKLAIIWALKFSTIERIRAGELGVKLKTVEGQGGNSDVPFDDHQINQMIESLEESNQAKELRHKITKAIGCAAYYSWFHSSKFCEEGGKIRMVAPNPFVEMYWETHFDWVIKSTKR
jgi:hypothetical protein